MSEDLYAPPTADLGGEGLAPIGGTGDVDIGLCFSEAWSNTWANFPLWLGVGLVGVLATMLAVVTVVGIFLIVPVLTWGMAYFFLRMHDGDAEFGDLFAGFSQYGAALAGMLVVVLLLILVGLAGQSVQIAGEAAESQALILLGVILNLAVSFLVTPRLSLAYFYVVDRGVPGFEAVQQAWTDTAPVKWKVLALMLLSLVIGLLGVLALLVGIIPAGVVIYLMWTSAYRQLVGRAAAA